jgi:RNA polymerase sigma-70 factor (ECF subfamily)
MTENHLVERCRQGDREAQRELYAQTCDRIYRLLLKMTHNPENASDLTQSTYIRVLQNIHQFDGASRLATWLYRVAVNEALQFLRGEKMRRLRELDRGQDAITGSETAAFDARMDVAEALTRLSGDERALIVLRYFEGLSYADMAEILGKPSGTIGSELNRVRQKLRDVLAPEAPITPGRNSRSPASNTEEGG